MRSCVQTLDRDCVLFTRYNIFIIRTPCETQLQQNHPNPRVGIRNFTPVSFISTLHFLLWLATVKLSEEFQIVNDSPL